MKASSQITNTSALLREYYYLTKPGIVRGNFINTLAGFLLAASGNVDFAMLGYTLLGISLIVACGCVLNNILDIKIDSKMKRTQKRALVSGRISKKRAFIFAIILGLLGSLLFGFFINKLSLLLSLFGLFMYVVVYGYFKRASVHGTVIGSISGAIPPVVGYVAVTNDLDLGALLLFLTIVFWQMPHFYAVAIYSSNEYKAASIPVLPVVKGIESVKRQTIYYLVAFCGAILSLWALGYTGFIYLLGAGGVSLYWLKVGLDGLWTKENNLWAEKVFNVSLIVVFVWCISIGVDGAIGV